VTNGHVLPGLDLASLGMEAPQFYLTGVSKWPGLRRLSLFQAQSLKALSSVRLSRLARLDLDIEGTGTRLWLPDAPALEHLCLHFTAPPDLSALAGSAIPAIELHHHGRDPLDVRPLAGLAGVVVNVYRRQAQVLGEDELGPGSSVRSAQDDRPASQ
jgi:hypothetical protein